MTTRELWKKIQEKSGLEGGRIDGDPGPITAKAIAEFMGIQGTPDSSLWPRDRYREMVDFYGLPGENMSRCYLPYEMVLDWDEGASLSSFSCHEKCVNVFESVFQQTLDAYGLTEIKRLGLNRFGGCLNVRKKRGGSTWSTHAWGCAIDLWPSKNKLRWRNDRAEFAKPDYLEFWNIVESHGGVSLGRERNYDWMHWQMCRI